MKFCKHGQWLSVLMDLIFDSARESVSDDSRLQKTSQKTKHVAFAAVVARRQLRAGTIGTYCTLPLQ
jgi:hypothetical protein